MTPLDLQGHWHRAWLKAPGFADHETRVHWLQAGALYADIRIPARRPDVRGATALADLPDATLLSLLDAEGFAGTITIENDVCTWDRQINWHGQPDSIDAGHMQFQGEDRLIETGVHADYAEQWDRRTRDPATAVHLSAEDRQVFVVSAGRRFVLGVGRAGAPSSLDAREALKAGQRSRALHAIFADVYALGVWSGTAGVADLCTNPLLEGKRVLSCDEEGALTWHTVDFLGRERNVRLTEPPTAHPSAA